MALSSDGATALVGALDDLSSPENAGPGSMLAGSAYVFDSSGGSWTRQAKLVPDDAIGGDEFGRSVALSSDGATALIGAPMNAETGSVSVFDRSGGSWTRQTILSADDGDDDDEFGVSVALSSDGATALIGANSDEAPNDEETGSAYVFDSSGGSWTQQAKLAPDDSPSDEEFGVSVALSSDGTTALIGAMEDGEPNNAEDPVFAGSGSAYVFDGASGSWTKQAKLAADDADGSDNFGGSVALSSDGTVALIGAFNDENPNGDSEYAHSGAGSAYVFDSSGGSWTQQTKLAADDGDSQDEFANSVALSADGATALIGAHNDQTPIGNDEYTYSGAGSVYVFDSSGGSWTQQVKVAPDDGESGDQFGQSVTLSSDGTALIGAAGDVHPNGEEAGSVYVFE